MLILVFEVFALQTVKLFFVRDNHPVVALAGIGIIFFVLPPLAYFLFVLFFGRNAYPVTRSPQAIPREERAYARLEVATKLEAKGRIQEALAAYQRVVDEFRGTAASKDAQQSIISIRAKTQS